MRNFIVVITMAAARYGYEK